MTDDARLKAQAEIILRLMAHLPSPEMDLGDVAVLPSTTTQESPWVALARTSGLRQIVDDLVQFTGFLADTEMLRPGLNAGGSARAAALNASTDTQSGYELTVEWADEYLSIAWQVEEDGPAPEIIAIHDVDTNALLAAIAVPPRSGGSVRLTRTELRFAPTATRWRITLRRGK